MLWSFFPTTCLSPGLSPAEQRDWLLGSLLLSTFPGSLLSPHSTYLSAPTSAPSSVSATHHLSFLWLLCWVRRTSLAQFFNSRHEVKQILDSKSGHVGSSPHPAFCLPRPLLLSHRDSEESTYSVLIILRIK